MNTQELNQAAPENSQVNANLQNWPETSEKSAIPAIRRENGQLLPGVVLNPGGRPKSKHITEAYKGILDDEGAEKYARVITGIALDGDAKASDRLAAVQEITDRVEGKAIQRQDVRGVFVLMPAESVVDALDSWSDDDT